MRVFGLIDTLPAGKQKALCLPHEADAQESFVADRMRADFETRLLHLPNPSCAVRSVVADVDGSLVAEAQWYNGREICLSLEGASDEVLFGHGQPGRDS